MKIPVIDKNIIVIVSGRVLQIGLTLASVRVFTSLLSTAEAGNLYLLNSILGLIGLTLLNPIGMYMNRSIHRWTAERTILSHFTLFNAYLISLSFFSAALMFALYKVMHIGVGMDLKFLLLVVSLFVFFNTWNTVIIPTLNLLNFQVSFVFFTLLTLLLSLIFSGLFSLFIKATALYWLAGQVLAQAIVNVFAYLHFRKVVHSRADVHHMRSVLTRENLANVISFIMPLVITTFCMWLQSQSYRIIIAQGIGTEFLGMIGLGLAVSSQIAAVVESIMQQIYYPDFYRNISTHDAAQRTEAWNALARRSLPAYMSLTICVSFIAPYLVNILADPKFKGASVFIVYGAWIELFRMTTIILASIAHSEMQTTSLMKSYFFGGLVSVLGVYFGMRTEHYEQVIPAMLVAGGMLTLVIMYHDMKKLMRFQLGFNRIVKATLLSLPFAGAVFFYSDRQNLMLSLGMVLVCGLYFLATQYYLSYKPRTEAGLL